MCESVGVCECVIVDINGKFQGACKVAICVNQESKPTGLLS